MIPVLCDSSKTLTQIVADTTNGIGRINALSAVVTEERNGIYELEMSVFLEDKHFSDISVGSIVKVKAGELEGNQLFRVYQITKPINGVCTVYAHHITYDLGKAAVLPFTATGAALALNGLISHLADTYEFGVYTDISNNTSTFTLEEPKHFRECLGGYQGSMLDVFGGEYRFDNLTVKLLAHRGNDNGVSIRYGKNLTDIEQETNIEQMYTAALGFAVVDEITTVGDLQKIVAGSASKTKIIDFSDRFDSGETVTKAQINALTQSYIDANDLNVPKINLKVSFVSLRDTEEYKNVAPLERVSLCDTVHVQFEKLGVNATAKVIRTEYDVLNERLVSVEIGDARTSFAQSITSEIVDETEQTTASMLQSAINHATEMITGGLGGYVVLSRNANGEPEEILIMDKPDKSQAVNVIRMNKNGIGFSTTGYSGQYTTAWTIDGAFVADFITSGQLNANLIKVGTIQDEQQTNYWNMETGEFRLATGVKVGSGTNTLGAINDTANAKKRNFTSQPTPPYDVGDLWCEGATGNILTCVTARTANESYNAADWEKRNKYTDDSAVTSLDNSLNQSGVFNRLTNNGALKGIYMYGGQLYINATYIKSGTLVLGGNNNASGTLRINNASGTQIGKWDKDGIAIGAGGTNYFTVDSSGNVKMTNGEIYQSKTVGSYGTAWLKITSCEIQGGYTGYGNTAELDLQQTWQWDGTRRSCASLSNGGGNAYVQSGYALGLFCGDLVIGNASMSSANKGYSGWAGDAYFVKGICC